MLHSLDIYTHFQSQKLRHLLLFQTKFVQPTVVCKHWEEGVSSWVFILYLIFFSYDNNTYNECLLSVKLCLPVVIKIVTVKNL